MEVYDVRSGSQERLQIDTDGLNAEGRRLFLGSMLRLLSRRYSHRKPILGADLRRLVALADDRCDSGGALV